MTMFMFFFKQKTAYEMRISDWSSDVCSSDLLLAQARKFNPRIVFFDKDRGGELFIRAIGGRYDVLRPGAPSGLNPLQLEDNAANRQFLIDWLALLAGGASVEELAEITEDRKSTRLNSSH